MHGLNPFGTQSHAEKTWTAEDKKHNIKTMWLKDEEFLPRDIPYARVLLHSYNANVILNPSTIGVTDQAVNLLERLRQERVDAPTRPLIFICHSLGGIIVKKALVKAKSMSIHNDIWMSSFGIVFFATPHRGGNGVPLGKIARSIVSKVLQDPNPHLLDVLERHSLYGNEVQQEFRDVLSNYSIISFYETAYWHNIQVVGYPFHCLYEKSSFVFEPEC